MAIQIKACSYEYDALDRLASRSSTDSGATRLYYCANTLATEVQGTQPRRFFRGGRHLLSQQNGSADRLTSTLIAADRSNNALTAATSDQHLRIAYSAYGHRETLGLLPGLPGFNGEHPDPLTGHYLLGNGYRAYNPVLMRFNSPDSLSPFGKGGLNAYAYCAGDPVNRFDPSGHELLDTVLSGLYIAAGVLTAGMVLIGARSSVVSLWKGVKVKPDLAAIPGIAAAHYRPTTSVEKLSAAIPIAAVVASPLWFSAYAIRTKNPDSQTARILSMIAVGITIPALFARGSLLVRSLMRKPAPAPVRLDPPGPKLNDMAVQTEVSFKPNQTIRHDWWTTPL
jgi:RHS repeat-associated protein